MTKKTMLLGVACLLTVAAVGLTRPVAAEDCVRANPTVTFADGSTKNSNPGDTRIFTLNVTNNDSVGCLTSDFAFETLGAPDEEWYTYTTPWESLGLAPQASVTVYVFVTPPSTAAAGDYALNFRTTQSYNDVTPVDDVVVDTEMHYIVDLVPPPAGDTIKPNVSITYPFNGAPLKRNTTHTIRANVSDNVGVTQTIYRANGVTLCSADGPLTSCDWRPAVRGSYTLTVSAFDAAGNARTATVLVNVR